jgi:hypothetical protein
MMVKPRTALAALATVTVAATTVAPGAATGVSLSGAEGPRARAAQVVLDWERIAFRTVYGEPTAPPTTPIPAGVPLLGFTSMAMYDAVGRSLERDNSSEAAAVAAAAHGVLKSYFLAAGAVLDADLQATLDRVPNGRAERVGVRVGRRAAARMIESRHHDGYADPTFHYNKPDLPGYWQPPPEMGDMLAAWLGSLRPLVFHGTVQVDGPPRLTSRAYAREFNEVKRIGSATSADRTEKQTATAMFFNSNSAVMVGDALIRLLEERPIGPRRTARLFAAMHAAMADSLIRCWELKRDVGFWRPSEAIAEAATDGNPNTAAEAGWTPLVPNPPYSDYVSGHACVTGPAVEVVRQTLGEHTTLKLISANSPEPRVFERLRRIERQAFMARIWSGLHFRTAMEDGYYIGHKTARRVLQLLP